MAGMRLAVIATVVVLGLIAVVILRTNVLAPPPAAERLAGVDVAVAGYTIDDLADDRHRLTITVAVTSERDLDECLAFALDQAFAHRRMSTADGECVRPVAGQRTAMLTYDGLTDDDLLFPAHSVVWGVPGGRCGIILELVGVCVVDFAGTADFELPSRSVLPSLGPFGSFGPLIPLFSFEPQ
jgi:hypothetical protein